jgi:2-polyprenyl-3-methyl-5-hydroxy-6-metoxy-1,4-benzoquinol methylase
MEQNKYDDPQFFQKYSQMPRSVQGLDVAGEWPAFKSLLPDLNGKSVLDLGCGFGWHCRYARERGAQRVLGIDISDKMLERARMQTKDSGIEYRQSAIEDLQFDAARFEAIISSLAFHYVEQFATVFRRVFEWLKPGGSFVFSVEHPIFTALPAQDWCPGSKGERLHWPVDDYHEEGIRHTTWMADNVVKYHRTLASYINGLIDAHFSIERVVEPTVPQELLGSRPDWQDEVRRPMFLLISATKHW